MRMPSEIIFSLWSTLIGQRAIVQHPLEFDNAYVHIPEDFSGRECQLILVYTIIWNLMIESTKDYTKGQIGFVGIGRNLRFGNKNQTEAVKGLLKKYEGEECLETTVGEVLENIRKREETGWERDKELRKDLKERLSSLLEEINYWSKVIVPEVL